MGKKSAMLLFTIFTISYRRLRRRLKVHLHTMEDDRSTYTFELPTSNSVNHVKDMDIVRYPMDRWCVVLGWVETPTSITLNVRRLSLYKWWPARQIQLFFLKKAFNKN